MFGSRWDKAEATILASMPKYGGDGTSPTYEFVAEVRPDSGAPAFRATIKDPMIALDFWRPSVGDVVSVLVKSNGKVKFDKDDPRMSVKAYEARRRESFKAALIQDPQAETLQDPLTAQSQAAQSQDQWPDHGSPAGPRGPQIFTLGGADPRRLRDAAEKLRAAGLGGLADQVEHAGREAVLGRSDQPGRPDQLGRPDQPDADPAARLGTLENLRERGLLTDDEYTAQRRRILDGI
jgi:hypothetical protein